MKRYIERYKEILEVLLQELEVSLHDSSLPNIRKAVRKAKKAINKDVNEIMLRDISDFSPRVQVIFMTIKIDTLGELLKVSPLKMKCMLVNADDISLIRRQLLYMDLELSKPSVDEAKQVKINDVEFSVRTHNCLRSANVKTLYDLVIHDESHWLKFRNFGRNVLKETTEMLAEYDLYFGMKFDC